MIGSRIGILIIAGDLFDAENRSTAEFESLCSQSKYRHLHVHIIPGNHDARLKARSFAAENLTVYSEPELKRFDLVSLPILFLPYREQTMGEAVAAFHADLKPGEWILIGHGDWADTLREPNPLEPGVYMPLTRLDVEATKPARTILGHIHKPFDRDAVHIPGSPCGLDITETGRRRILVLDTDTGSVQDLPLETDHLYFDERLIVLPLEREEDFIRERMEALIRTWGINDSERKRIVVRLKVSGYTTDKQRLMKILKTLGRGMRFYPDGEPDLSEVSVAEDADRVEIAERVRKLIETMSWPSGPEAPTREAAFVHALKTIFEA